MLVNLGIAMSDNCYLTASTLIDKPPLLDIYHHHITTTRYYHSNAHLHID